MESEPHPPILFHLVPREGCTIAIDALNHPDNTPFVSQASNRNDGFEIGFHVRARPCPQVIAEIGRNADLILSGPSVSKVHFSFEVHPESQKVMLHDRSRYRNTTVEPLGFRMDGDFRQILLTMGTEYSISAGGLDAGAQDRFKFTLIWMPNSEKILEAFINGQYTTTARRLNPRWARTIEARTEVQTWYNTRLHSRTNQKVRTVVEKELIGRGAFGEVFKAFDVDSGCTIAVKKFERRGGENFHELLLQREIKVLSTVSHVGSIFMSTHWMRPSLIKENRKISSNFWAVQAWAPIPFVFS